MSEPSEKFKDLDFLIGRVGLPLVLCGILAWIVAVKLKDLEWKLERSIRNERAIMQKLNIPVILDGDRPSEK